MPHTTEKRSHADATLSDYNQQVLDKFRSALIRLEDTGEQDAASEPPTRVVQRLISAIPRRSSKWNDAVGPFFTADGVAELRGITKQAVSKAADANRLLRVRTTDNRSVYPVFQFRPTGETLPQLSAVLTELRKGIDDSWTWALWLSGKTKTFGGRSAVDLLWTGESETVLAEARHTAAAWAD